MDLWKAVSPHILRTTKVRVTWGDAVQKISALVKSFKTNVAWILYHEAQRQYKTCRRTMILTLMIG